MRSHLYLDFTEVWYSYNVSRISGSSRALHIALKKQSSVSTDQAGLLYALRALLLCFVFLYCSLFSLLLFFRLIFCFVLSSTRWSCSALWATFDPWPSFHTLQVLGLYTCTDMHTHWLTSTDTHSPTQILMLVLEFTFLIIIRMHFIWHSICLLFRMGWINPWQ